VRARRVLALAAAVGCLGGVSACVAAAAEIRVTSDAPVSASLRPARACADAEFAGSAFEPAIAVDAHRPRRIVAAWSQGFEASNSAVAATADGGQTWKTRLVPGVSRCSGGDTQIDADPWISFGPRGTAYLSSIPANTPAQPSLVFFSAIAVNRSGDDVHWSQPSIVSPLGSDFNDKDSITADPNRPGTVYVVWARRYGAEAESGRAYFSRSVDAGRTWTEPALNYQPPVPFLIPANAQVLVEPDGSLVEVFDQLNESSQVPGRPADVAWQIMAMRSGDRGRSWSAPVHVATLPRYGSAIVFSSVDGVPLRAPALSSRAVGAGGRLYVVWQAVYSSTRAQILMSQSGDGGRTWTPPSAVASRSALVLGPSVAVTGDGTLGVFWYDLGRDRPDDGKVTTEVRFAASRDRGRHWIRGRIAGPFDYRRAPKVGELEGRSGGAHFLGDYFGLAAPGKGFAAAYVRPSRTAHVERGPTVAHVARVRVVEPSDGRSADRAAPTVRR
jgi:hypothetical protein